MTVRRRRPSPFKVGDRVVTMLDGPGLLAARRGVVVEVRDEWLVRGNHVYQAVNVDYDPDDRWTRSGAILPWSVFDTVAE